MSKWLLVGLLISMLVLVSCGGSTPAPGGPGGNGDIQRGGRIVFGVNQEGDMLDPHVGSSRYDYLMLANIYDSLMYWNGETGVPEPWLAESVTPNDDYTIFAIKLREDVTFHDGEPLNAEAVKFNLDRIKNPETASTSAVGDLVDYVESRVTGEFTLDVEFSRSNPLFEDALCGRVGMMNSPKAVQELGEDYLRQVVSTGPFKVVEWIDRDHVTLERNDDYAWPNPASTNPGPPYLDEIEFRFIPEDGARTAALEAGELDGTMRVPFQDVESLQLSGKYQTFNTVLPGTGVIIIMNASKFPMDDIRVRQAILHMTDQETVDGVGYFDVAGPHRGSMLSEPNASFVDLSDMYNYNEDRANQLLDEAGWTQRGSDGIRVKDGQPLEIDYIGFASPVTQRVMEYLQSEWRKIGIAMNILQMDGPAIQSARRAGDHHIAHLTFIIQEKGVRMLFHSENIGGGWNFTHYPDSELDALIERADAELDRETRYSLYSDVQRMMLEKALIIPQVYQVNVAMLREGIEGYKYESLSVEPPYFQETWIRE